MRAPLLLAVVALGACGGGASCPDPLPPTHLYEGFCAGGSGFCLSDQQTGF